MGYTRALVTVCWPPFLNAAATTVPLLLVIFLLNFHAQPKDQVYKHCLYLLICCLPELLLVLQVIGAAVGEVVIHSQGTAQRLQTGTAKQQYTDTTQVIPLMMAYIKFVTAKGEILWTLFIIWIQNY
jgi:hypothetical protein